MLISAITPFSLIEFPGEISCIVFTPGCNMRCGFCHNSGFVLPEKLKKIQKDFIPEANIMRFLESRKNLLSGISICGGEPTIHRDLIDFCRKVKALGYKIKLDTNGTNPKMLQDMLAENLLDYIAMDIKHEAKDLNALIGVNINKKLYEKSIEIIKKSGIDYEFRTTVIGGVHTKESIEQIAQQIQGAKKYALQSYRSGNTLNPCFSGYSYTQEVLAEFQALASEYVEDVIVRI